MNERDGGLLFGRSPLQLAEKLVNDPLLLLVGETVKSAVTKVASNTDCTRRESIGMYENMYWVR